MTEGEFLLEKDGGKFTVYRMDCIAGMAQKLERESVDVIVTSPPYNLGVKYREYDDAIPRERYLEWIGEWGKAARGVLRDAGSLFLNIGAKPSDPWVPFEVVSELRKYFHLQNVIHWIKSIAIQKSDVGDYPGITRDIAVGHYKPINSDRFLNDCQEYIFHLTKTGEVELDRLAIGVEYQDKSNISRWTKTRGDFVDRRCRGNTWFVPYATIRSREDQRPHPATFPVKIPEMCIRLHGLKKARLVMDPFVGIGHSAVACANLGINFVGFEIDEEYYSTTCENIRNAIKNKPMAPAGGMTIQRPLVLDP